MNNLNHAKATNHYLEHEEGLHALLLVQAQEVWGWKLKGVLAPLVECRLCLSFRLVTLGL
jgi:hypothetical protein